MYRSQRAELVHGACAEIWHGDGSLDIVRDGCRLVFDQQPDYIYGADGQIIGVDAWVRLFGPDGHEIPVDPHRRIVNPPTIHEGQADAAAAFRAAVWDSVRDSPNPDGWRTSGTVTVVFAGTADGRVTSEDQTYSTARAGNALGADSTGAIAYCGQQANTVFFQDVYECAQVFIGFDTAAITDSDIVSAVVLDMWLDGDFSDTDFVTEVRDKDWGSSLTTADWVAGASLSGLTLVASINSSGIGSTGAYKTFTSETAFGSMGNLKTGVVNLMLSSSRQRLGNAPASDTAEYLVWALADSSGTSNDPKLTITHSAASTPATATPSTLAATVTMPAAAPSTGSTVTPTTAAVTVTMPAPSPSGGATPTPATIAAVVTVPDPVIQTGGNITVPPDSITVAVAIPIPTIAVAVTATPAPLGVTVAIPTPTIIIPVHATVAADVLGVVVTVLPVTVDTPTLPGSLITEDGQLEYGDPSGPILLGSGTVYRLRNVRGWDSSGSIDNGNTNRQRRHGARAGTKYAQQRIVTAVVMIDSIDDPKQVADLYADLELATPILEDADEVPLVIRLYNGKTRLAYGALIDRDMPNDADYNAGAAQVGLQFACSDPLRYSIDAQTAVINPNATVHATNAGNAKARPEMIRISGACTNPQVINTTTGRRLAFGIVLAADEWISIDCNRNTARLNDTTSVLAGLTAASVPSPEAYWLAPGDNQLTFACTSPGAGARLDYVFRHSYL